MTRSNTLNAPIVMKFGGTALGDGARIDAAARIVAGQLAERPIVVVSAIAGATDLLERAAAAASRGAVDARAVRLRHRSVLSELGLDPELLNRLLSELGVVLELVRARGRLEPRERDVILSFGERMSARIFARVLAARGVDATPIDAFDLGLRSDSNHGRARPLPDATDAMARSLVAIPGVPVVTGFLAADREGNLTTLGRNGSDLSAALVAEAARAKEAQFWKTVDGVMTADPKLASCARSVEHLSYREAALLGFFGARVLFREALEPLARAQIPASVRSVDRPHEPGTRVDAVQSANGPRAIACRRQVQRLRIALGGLDERARSRERFYVQLACSSIDVFAIDEGPDEIVLVAGESDELAALLRAGGSIAAVERDLALVTLIGQDVGGAPTIGARARFVRGESESLLVADAELVAAVRELHARNFEAREPSLA